MQYAHADDGTRLAYESVGHGPAGVLFLHGWAGTRDYFRELIGFLDPARTCAVSFDLRGHGHSDAGANDYSMQRVASDALAVMDAAGLAEAMVLGFSMSGKYAQYVTVAHPSRVSGQMLVAGSPAGTIALPAEILDDWYGRAGDAEAMIELVRGLVAGSVDEAALTRFGRAAARIERAVLEATMSACLTSSFADQLSSITVPTIVVGGLRDGIFTPELLRDGMVAQIPGARLALLDCAHEIPLEKPRELAAVIESFLAGIVH